MSEDNGSFTYYFHTVRKVKPLRISDNGINDWLVATFNTEQKIVFPYGNKYGWGVAHKKKNKLICNVFAEDNAFTVMMRLSDKQYKAVYNQLHKYTQECIDNRYPCGDGGWIHYRVTCNEHFDNIKTLLSVKCS